MLVRIVVKNDLETPVRKIRTQFDLMNLAKNTPKIKQLLFVDLSVVQICDVKVVQHSLNGPAVVAG